jgi:hypothetical protein
MRASPQCERETPDSAGRRNRPRLPVVTVLMLLGLVSAFPDRAEACPPLDSPPPTILATGVWEISYTINSCGALYTPQTTFSVDFLVLYTPPNAAAPTLLRNPTITGEIGSVVGVGERIIHWDPAVDNVPAGSRIETILRVRPPRNYARVGGFGVGNYLADDNVPMISLGPSVTIGRYIANAVAVEAQLGLGVSQSEASTQRFGAILKQDVVMANLRVRVLTLRRISLDIVGGGGATNQYESSALGQGHRQWLPSAAGGMDANLAITSRLSFSAGGRAFWVDRDKTTLPLRSVAIHIPFAFEYVF